MRQRRDGRGRRYRVQRHVEDRGDTACCGGGRRRCETFPFGPAGLVDVHMGVDDARDEDLVVGQRVSPRRLRSVDASLRRSLDDCRRDPDRTPATNCRRSGPYRRYSRGRRWSWQPLCRNPRADLGAAAAQRWPCWWRRPAPGPTTSTRPRSLHRRVGPAQQAAPAHGDHRDAGRPRRVGHTRSGPCRPATARPASLHR